MTAGLTLHWSSGSIEGAVNRVKKIKRQLYGRAVHGLAEALPQVETVGDLQPRRAPSG